MLSTKFSSLSVVVICGILFRVETHALKTPVAHELLLFVELGTTARHMLSNCDPCSGGANLGLGLGVVSRLPKFSSCRGLERDAKRGVLWDGVIWVISGKLYVSDGVGGGV